MYRIGDFALISRVSIKMLRHYDAIGLFSPAHIDAQTGYRHYTLEQLPRLYRIVALKSMGFSLDEIGQLLDGYLSTETIERLIDIRREAMRRELAEIKARLKRLDLWRERLMMEGKIPDYEVILKPFTPVAGEPGLPSPSEGPITRPLTNRGGLAEDVLLPPEQLPQAEALACAVHTGDEASLIQAYQALDRWIQAHGYRIAGTPREIPLTDAAGAPVIELQMPVRTGESAG
jgi:DNA-binding transcriptional MerR regulator